VPSTTEQGVVLDTHAWIWWVSDPKRLSSRARAAVEEAAWLGVAAITLWEVAMLATRGRIVLDRPLRSWLVQALALPHTRLCELTPAIAAHATGSEADALPSDPADRLIYSTAEVEGARLATRDRALTAYDRARPPAHRIVVW
jgi:PIN domain nuclease of toxin-antitoxin system